MGFEAGFWLPAGTPSGSVRSQLYPQTCYVLPQHADGGNAAHGWRCQRQTKEHVAKLAAEALITSNPVQNTDTSLLLRVPLRTGYFSSFFLSAWLDLRWLYELFWQKPVIRSPFLCILPPVSVFLTCHTHLFIASLLTSVQQLCTSLWENSTKSSAEVQRYQKSRAIAGMHTKWDRKQQR